MDDSSVFGRKDPPPAPMPAWAIVDRFPGVGPLEDDSHEPLELRRNLNVALLARVRWASFGYGLAGGAS